MFLVKDSATIRLTAEVKSLLMPTTQKMEECISMTTRSIQKLVHFGVNQGALFMLPSMGLAMSCDSGHSNVKTQSYVIDS